MKHVLFVDDNSNTVRAFVRLLATQYVVQGAESAASALEYLESMRYDVVVTDLRLGSFDGVDLMRVIRRQYPEIRVILVSGLEVAPETSSLFDRYLRKPVEWSSLVKAIEGSTNENGSSH